MKPTYRIYYFDNDAQRRIIATGLDRFKAIRLWQTGKINGLDYSYCDLKYEMEEK